MMWLIKLPFRLLAIPVFLAAWLFLIVIKLLSYLGNLAGGLVILIVAGGIIFYIYKMQWTNLFLSVLVGVMVLAVVHLKRPDKGKSWNEGRQVSLTDLRGSSSLEQLSDAVVALERDQQAEEGEADIARLRVLKNRPIGQVGEAGTCIYCHATGRLLPGTPFDTTDGEENGSAKSQDAEAETDF